VIAEETQMENQVGAVEVEEVVELLDAELDLVGGEGIGSSAKETRIETTKEVEVEEVEVIELSVVGLDLTGGGKSAVAI
jgi:hypothetical protein